MFITELKPDKDLTATVYKAATFRVPAYFVLLCSTLSVVKRTTHCITEQNTTEHHAEGLQHSGSIPRGVATKCAGKETALCDAKENNEKTLCGQCCQIN
jgi:hypothetical protein